MNRDITRPRSNAPILALRAASWFLLVALAGSTASAQPRFVRTSGKQFVTADGKPLVLKGIGLGNWLVPEGYMFGFDGKANSPRQISEVIDELIGEEEGRNFWRTFRENYVTRDDIHFLKNAGFNSVRVPFDYRLFVTDAEPRRFEGAGWALLDRLVGWCRDEGLYVVLDLHAAPGGQTGDNIDNGSGYPYLFESADSQELTVQLWRTLAQRYAKEPTVLGYDLLNEPIATHFDAASFNPKLEPLYKRIVAAIREVDRNHVILLGGAQWDGNFSVFGPPFDPQLAYTFHKYWTETTQSVIQEYVDFGSRYNVPIWLGESGENTDEWIDSFRKLLEKNDVGWCFWPYKRLDSTRCVVSNPKTPEWQTIVEYANTDRSTFEAIRKSRPPRATVEKALGDYLANVKLKNCRVNEGYLKALGLR